MEVHHFSVTETPLSVPDDAEPILEETERDQMKKLSKKERRKERKKRKRQKQKQKEKRRQRKKNKKDRDNRRKARSRRIRRKNDGFNMFPSNYDLLINRHTRWSTNQVRKSKI